MMNAQKNNQIDLAEKAMRHTFKLASNQLDYDLENWSSRVMADIRAESFDEPIDFKLLGGLAWFAVAASLLIAAFVFIATDNVKIDSVYDYYGGEQLTLESAYRN